ncbi:MAG: hypothetical protein JW717_11605 [Marinilabiliaceae bacterium]|nr:hypothetical protein [Marinilabiliaceae bacterium]
MNIATQLLHIRAEYSGDDLWDENAIIQNAYPIYLDGIDGISYFECKVVNNTSDAGYILICVNKKDYINPEANPISIGAFEKIVSLTGNSNIKLYRYAPFTYICEDLTSGKIIGSMGIESNPWTIYSMPKEKTFNEQINQFRQKAIETGIHPTLTRAELDAAYQTSSSLAKKRQPTTTTTFLKNKFQGYHTPRWHQPTIEADYAVGCANTAWATVYGYWSKFKGKTDLFAKLPLGRTEWLSGTTNNVPEIKNAMRELFDYNNSFGVCFNKNSMTLPWTIANGIGYAENYGYSLGSSCVKVSSEGIVPNYNSILDEIKNDRPLIVLIQTGNSWIFPDHYVVIEGVSYTTGTRQVVLNGGLSGSDLGEQKKIDLPKIEYFVNYGDAGASVWLAPSDKSILSHYKINVGEKASLAFNVAGNGVRRSFSILTNLPTENRIISWDFGDGKTANTANAEHVFPGAGRYPVKLSFIYTNLPPKIYTVRKTIDITANNIVPILTLLLD